LFDKDHKFLDVAYAPVTSSGVPTLVGRSYTVREAGYAYLYISNEQVMQTDVYFDDVKFTYTPTNVLQYTEFYSHGAPNAQSWTRENTTANNFLGNGGTELNPTTSLYDLHYRNYDPVLGRMNQIDPVADKYGSVTPYNYAFNSPVNLNDPMGDDPPFFNRELWKGNVRGAVYNNRGIEGHENSRSLSLVGWGAQYNSGAMNFGLMSTNQFVNYYGVNQMSGPEKASFAQGFSVNKGGGMSGLINASLYFSGTNGNTQGADPFTFSNGKKNFGGVYHTTNNKITSLTYNPVIDAGNGNWLESDDIVLEDFEYNGTCPTCLDPSTVGRNAGLSYPGPFNPMTYPDENGNRRPDYTTVPKSFAEYPAIGHDRRYDNLKISGFWGLVSNTRAIGADWQFVSEELNIAFTPYMDPVTRLQSAFFGTVLGGLALTKTIIGLSTPQSTANVIMWYHISNIGVTNAPTKTGK